MSNYKLSYHLQKDKDVYIKNNEEEDILTHTNEARSNPKVVSAQQNSKMILFIDEWNKKQQRSKTPTQN